VKKQKWIRYIISGREGDKIPDESSKN